MRWEVAGLVVAAGCGWSDGRLAATTDGDGGTIVDGRPDVMPVVWRIETDADFRLASAGNLVAIERGGLEPVAWTYGALRMAGANTQLFTSAESQTLWADTLANVQPDLISGTGLTTLPVFDQRRPGGVGLDADTTWTMWGEGEMFLEAGTHEFELTGDDHAILEIAVSGMFTRVVSSAPTFPNTVAGSITIGETGWHPVRVALSQGTGGATFHLTDDPPGPIGRNPIERWRYRASTNDLRGLYMIGSDHLYNIGPMGSDLYEKALVVEDYGAGMPADLGITDDNTWSVRWAGQFWVETAGDYVFAGSSDDGQRLRIDGAVVIDLYTPSVVSGMSPMLTLARGWHEIELDLLENTGNANISLTILSGPAGAGDPLPLANLRPVTGRGERIASASRIVDGRFEAARSLDTSLTFHVVGAPGANATSVDVGFTADHGAWSEVEVALVPPSGTSTLIRNNESATAGTRTFVYNDVAPIGTWPVDGLWTLTFEDTVGGSSGTALRAFLTIHHSGGSPAIAQSSSWTSEVRDQGASLSVASVTWDGVFPAGSFTQLEVRTCEMADCSDGVWMAVTASGTAVTTPAGRYAQVRVTFTTDGDAAPWLDWIEVVAQ